MRQLFVLLALLAVVIESSPEDPVAVFLMGLGSYVVVSILITMVREQVK